MAVAENVALAAEKITTIGPLPITNTLITSWLVVAILLLFAYFVNKKVSMVPGPLQNFAESIIEFLHDMVESVAGEKTKVFFPIIATFFFFIIVGNYVGLLPGVGTIGFHGEHGEFIPLFRSINSDINTTLALAIVSTLTTHYFAIKYVGISSYIQKWVSLNPIMLFVGLIEFAGEFTKVISLSFRLFGNIYAGESVLHTASHKLSAFIVPIPFLSLELIVGFVQALVFSMLTLVFMVLLSQKHEH